MADICNQCKYRSYVSVYCPARTCDIMFDCEHYVKDDNLVSRKGGYKSH